MNAPPTATAAERLLRGDAADVPDTRALLTIGVVGSAAVGAALGAGSGEPWLALFATIKVPLLLAVTTVICLPSFFVVNAVLGLGDHFRRALRGLLAAQAMLGLALGALTPLVVFSSISVRDPYLLTLLDGLVFAVATWAAQHVLARHYGPLIAIDRRHRAALASWLVLYAFAGMQAAWVLRPFRGTEGFAVQFLRPEAFEQNAYVVLLEHAARLFR